MLDKDKKNNRDYTGTSRDPREGRDENGKFQKGYTGNPNGKPKGSLSITSLVKNKLSEYPNKEQDGTYAEQIVQSILKEALKGNPKMQELVWNYIDGKPTSKISFEDEQVKDAMDKIDEVINKSK